MKKFRRFLAGGGIDADSSFMFLDFGPAAQCSCRAVGKWRVGWFDQDSGRLPVAEREHVPAVRDQRAGIFEKHGFDAELIYVQGVHMVQVHTAGQLDFTSTSGIVTLQSSVNGSDLILLVNSIESHLVKVIAHPLMKSRCTTEGTGKKFSSKALRRKARCLFTPR